MESGTFCCYGSSVLFVRENCIMNFNIDKHNFRCSFVVRFDIHIKQKSQLEKF